MRNSWYSTVKTDGDIQSLTQIGIKTSESYMDGGKLIVDEDKLRAALNDDPEGVQNLFSNSAKDQSRGLVNRLEDSLTRSEEHTSELQSRGHLVCRLLLGLTSS